jgi:hypothetical protein
MSVNQFIRRIKSMRLFDLIQRFANFVESHLEDERKERKSDQAEVIKNYHLDSNAMMTTKCFFFFWEILLCKTKQRLKREQIKPPTTRI